MPKIAVVGDAMVDFDTPLELVKTIDNMPVYRELPTTHRQGGAVNVVDMVEALGATSGHWSNELSKKHRYFCPDGTVFRIDDDMRSSLRPDKISRWEERLSAINPDIIVVCDHAKGVITQEVMNMLKSLGKPIYVDPCLKSDWSLFDGVECISANREEWEDHIPCSDVSIKRMDTNGVIWWNRDENHTNFLLSVCNNVVDTVGAGDQFIAMLSVMRSRGNSWEESIEWANIAAGLQCERQGIVPVTFMDMTCAIEQSQSKVPSTS